MSELSNVCHAVGVLQVADSNQLHERPCTIVVRLVPARDEYEAKNEVDSCKALPGGFGVQAAAPVQQTAQPAQQQVPPVVDTGAAAAAPAAAGAGPAPGGTPPWKR